MQGRYLELLSWPEAEQAILQLPVVLLPLGARTKEHGPHLPLNNDWLIAEYLTRRVVAECPVLALPTVQYGYYPAFGEYPGSVNVRWEACRDTLTDICESLARHGARRFYVLNTGISTNKPLEATKATMLARGSKLDFTDIATAYASIRRQVETQPAGTHADEVETSMMLYIAPDVVRMDLAERDIHPDKGPGGLTRDPNATTGVYSPTGSYGDPTQATAAKGKIVVEGMVGHLIERINELAAEPVRRVSRTMRSR
jgi:creatinine amidohydrolase